MSRMLNAEISQNGKTFLVYLWTIKITDISVREYEGRFMLLRGFSG